jgi:hypothetical protein
VAVEASVSPVVVSGADDSDVVASVVASVDSDAVVAVDAAVVGVVVAAAGAAVVSDALSRSLPHDTAMNAVAMSSADQRTDVCLFMNIPPDVELGAT